jgi:hypothetical protein
MKKWMDRIGSLFLIGLSVLIFSSSLKLGIGDFGNPGPGFMPFFASILLFSLSSLVFIKGIIGSSKDEEGELSIGWENLTKPINLMIALICFSFLFKALGYLITTFLLMFAMFFIYEPKKWYVHIVISAIVASLSFLVFYTWLRVQLPTGIFRIHW